MEQICQTKCKNVQKNKLDLNEETALKIMN